LWPVNDAGPGSFPTTIVASSDDGNVAANTMDADLTTRWSAEGDGEWIGYDMGADGPVSAVSIAWYSGDQRRSTFDIEVAGDGEDGWRTVFSGTSSGTSTEPEMSTFAETTARYLRIVGHGNSASAWNSIAEVSIAGRTVAVPEVEPFLTTVSVSLPAVALGHTERLTVEATLSDGSAADLSTAEVSYVSNDPAVATVDDTGAVTGVGEGTTEIAVVVVTRDWRLVHGRAAVTVSDPLRPVLSATADTYVNDGSSAATNYGTSPVMLIKKVAAADSGYNRMGLVRFEPTATDLQVTSVVLRLWAKIADADGTEFALDVAALDGSFDETTTTWATKPSLTDLVGSAMITSTAQWYEIDVTEPFAAAVRAGTVIDIALTQDPEPGRGGLTTNVSTRESAYSPQLRVQLEE